MPINNQKFRVTIEWANGQRDSAVCKGSDQVNVYLWQTVAEFTLQVGDKISIEAVE